MSIPQFTSLLPSNELNCVCFFVISRLLLSLRFKLNLFSIETTEILWKNVRLIYWRNCRPFHGSADRESSSLCPNNGSTKCSTALMSWCHSPIRFGWQLRRRGKQKYDKLSNHQRRRIYLFLSKMKNNQFIRLPVAGSWLKIVPKICVDNEHCCGVFLFEIN